KISWTPQDKVEQVQKLFGSSRILFGYDAQGNRVKKVAADGTTTYYVREAGGEGDRGLHEGVRGPGGLHRPAERSRLRGPERRRRYGP
ncbi:MAG TPA: hypothetical protein VHC20_03985, partial [Candidatus Paceibacterota bacterium]|nr:hypothetical protein [Candidatus Paceibacterota bacterium]